MMKYLLLGLIVFSSAYASEVEPPARPPRYVPTSPEARAEAWRHHPESEFHYGVQAPRADSLADCQMSADQLTISCPNGSYAKTPAVVDALRNPDPGSRSQEPVCVTCKEKSGSSKK